MTKYHPLEDIEDLTEQELDSVTEIHYDPSSMEFTLIADSILATPDNHVEPRMWRLHNVNPHQAETYLKFVEFSNNSPFHRDNAAENESQRYVRDDVREELEAIMLVEEDDPSCSIGKCHPYSIGDRDDLAVLTA